MREFFQELKRRHVYKVAVTYAVVAFVTLQAAALVFPATTLAGVYDVLVLVAFIGFPLAVVLAWAFEVTPEGVRRAPPVPAGDEATDATGAEDTGGDGRPRGGEGTSLAWAWALGLAVLVAGSAYLAWGSVRSTPGGPGGGTARTSIAVLPFASLSPDAADAYFAAGLSEELIHALARLGDLRVTARTSAFTLGGAGLEARQIADSLGVATVLEGSVRRSAGKVRVTAQLVDAGTGFELWSGRFERPEGELLAVQDSMVGAIVEALQVELRGGDRARIRENLAAAHPADAGAYDLYLRARHVWLQRGDPRRALELFRAAVDLEPTFARGWAGVADAYTILGSQGTLPADEAHPAARAAAERALELAPDLGEAHASLGAVFADYYWEWEAAERHLRRAVELAPSYATAHEWYAELLSRTGRSAEAVRVARQARRVDPLSEPARASLIHALRLAGRLDEAREEARRQLEVAPDYVFGPLNLGLVLLDEGRPEEAAERFRETAERSGGEPSALALMGAARARAGDREGALEALDRLREKGSAAPLHRAMVLAALGEEDAALDALEAGLEDRHWLMGTLAVEPMWDPLRDRPRFRAILERIGLAPYARRARHGVGGSPEAGPRGS